MRYAAISPKIAITNTVGSSVTRLAGCTVFMNSGPEIGVAATKTFTSQLAIIFKIVYGKERLSKLSDVIGAMLDKENEVKA